jgi:hypothetical protein
MSGLVRLDFAFGWLVDKVGGMDVFWKTTGCLEHDGVTGMWPACLGGLSGSILHACSFSWASSTWV